MAWGTRLAEGFVGWLEARGVIQRPRPINRHVQRPALQESVSAPPGTGQSYYGGYKVIRDLTPAQHTNLIGMAEFLVANDAVASRLVDMRTALVCGEGWTPTATSKVPAYRDAVQRKADEVWDLLGWEDRLFARVRDLSVTGETIHWRPKPNVVEGWWESGVLLPHNVAEVLAHPLNCDCLAKLRLHYPGLEWEEVQADGKREKRRQTEFSIVRREKFGEHRGRLTGEVFLLGINRFPGGTRGLSDLLPWREWIDMYAQALYTAQDRLRVLASVVYDVTKKGADEDALEFRRSQIREEGPPKGLTVRLHSEDEAWQAISPEGAGGDSETIMDRMFKQILGSAGIPYMWWTEGGDTNRATAREMDTPVWATIRNRKDEVAGLIELEVAYALQDVGDAGGLVTAEGEQVPEGERGFEMQSRDPDRTAYDAVGQNLLLLGQAMALAVQTESLSKKEAAMIYRSAAEAETGLTLDPWEETEGDDPLAREEARFADALEQAKARLQGQPANGTARPARVEA